MGFGLSLVEKGRLEISRRAVLWELLEGGFGFERSSQWEIERQNNWWIEGVLLLANGGCRYYLLTIAGVSHKWDGGTA